MDDSFDGTSVGDHKETSIVFLHEGTEKGKIFSVLLATGMWNKRINGVVHPQSGAVRGMDRCTLLYVDRPSIHGTAPRF